MLYAVQHEANSDLGARCPLRCRTRANDREATLKVLTAGPAECQGGSPPIQPQRSRLHKIAQEAVLSKCCRPQPDFTHEDPGTTVADHAEIRASASPN
ncbi:hypothetical protein BDW42DRAFT_76695 [Aspergillus taichungensis]|uniref:Uncharacterized protein n=1 Tax=Aspergillus taichungensis TaxID=482145 RepID=A0A2J5I916_9EURO|nr:hypothetical protein BDW42DRAFT_76695 [Aspergillus taichungensis]